MINVEQLNIQDITELSNALNSISISIMEHETSIAELELKIVQADYAQQEIENSIDFDVIFNPIFKNDSQRKQAVTTKRYKDDTWRNLEEEVMELTSTVNIQKAKLNYYRNTYQTLTILLSKAS